MAGCFHTFKEDVFISKEIATAKVRLAPWLREVYGSYRDQVTFRRRLKGRTSIIKKADMSGVTWSLPRLPSASK
jgi:hypothetical protein